ncbi:MAG: BREX system Lon protease-like protein BrxL, partial [SAR324 cluster bacterium]|nr:BREX system Lon protease-like protein BrxL [SAR324 cluster bacterium]
LGPKGTGKSHIYSEFSPHGILISGGEVTVPKLFVNNSNGKIGLVGYWDTVAFDEFAGKTKKANKALVDIMKNYMANKTFSRGVETLGAQASMVFVGNTQHALPYMLKHSDLFDELPAQYHDSAFLDRLHFYIPGWEVDIIRGEMFSDGYGFVVDYLAEILRSLRDHDYSQLYADYFTLSTEISTRDRDGINKTFSGLMKILFPQKDATKEQIEEILRFSFEGRKRVKDQLMRIDSTYNPVRFEYSDADGKKHYVKTLEEKEYPLYYKSNQSSEAEEDTPVDADEENKEEPQPDAAASSPALKEDHVTFEENQRGVSFDDLFGPYLKGARKITITDPYIRAFHQARNLMEFLETVVKQKAREDEVEIHLVTIQDEGKPDLQLDHLEKMRDSCAIAEIRFSWEFDQGTGLHARHIVTDTGWKILLDCGLDIFLHYEMNDAFAIANRQQKYRPCKAFEVTYLRV